MLSKKFSQFFAKKKHTQRKQKNLANQMITFSTGMCFRNSNLSSALLSLPTIPHICVFCDLHSCTYENCVKAVKFTV